MPSGEPRHASARLDASEAFATERSTVGEQDG